MTDCPKAPSMRATVGSATLHFTLASLAGLPAASRRSAKKPALSPTFTVADSGETVTEATGPGFRPGIESPEALPTAVSPSGRPAPSCSLQAATASAVAASAAVRTPFMRFLRECVQTGYPALLLPGHIGPPPAHRHSRSDLPFTRRIPHSTFRIVYARASHRLEPVRRRADRRPARPARGKDRAGSGERGSRRRRDPHAAAARRAAHRNRGGDGPRRGHARAADGAARPLLRPARRARAAARGHEAHRREPALGARPHDARRR